MNQRIARAAKLSEEQVTRVLEALGPAVQDELKRGKTVNLSGLGTFRVVRIAEHKDLRNGQPVTVPATNTIEFLPVASVVDSANSAGAQPSETVPAFEYTPLPTQTPGQRTQRTYTAPLRTR
jgi:nucleoid DNA-binding protein